MELTRRDAVAALAAAGIGVAGGAAVIMTGDEDREGRPTAQTKDPPDPIEDGHLTTLIAAAEVLYPSELDGIGAFVETFVRGRARDRPDHAEGIVGAIEYLDEYARSWHDDRFAALDPAGREEVLRDLSVDTIDADPDGDNAQRVRYYVRNELLLALYSSPTGGELVGLENPQGHPGGTTSYRRGPGGDGQQS